MLCALSMKLIVKYFLFGDFFVGLGGGGVILVLDKYIFLWQTHFILGVVLD